jgi:hypothetical protein
LIEANETSLGRLTLFDELPSLCQGLQKTVVDSVKVPLFWPVLLLQTSTATAKTQIYAYSKPSITLLALQLLLLTISNIDRPPDSQAMPVIKYAIRGHATVFNQWQDAHYFLAAFPTLFPMGVGGHLDQRLIPACCLCKLGFTSIVEGMTPYIST